MIASILYIVAVLLAGEFILKRLARLFGLYTTVGERECKVYVLFGQVLGR